MFSPLAKHFLPTKALSRSVVCRGLSTFQINRFKSTSAESKEDEESSRSYAFDKNGESTAEVVSFPTSTDGNSTVANSKPLILNAKEHAVGYLSKILNARVYEAAIETELQEAHNLSAVRRSEGFCSYTSCINDSSFVFSKIPAFEKYRAPKA
jgi:hypothetical protein